MKCKFSKIIDKDEGILKLEGGQEMPKSECIQYLESIIHKNREIKEEVKHHIWAGEWNGECIERLVWW